MEPLVCSAKWEPLDHFTGYLSCSPRCGRSKTELAFHFPELGICIPHPEHCLLLSGFALLSPAVTSISGLYVSLWSVGNEDEKKHLTSSHPPTGYQSIMLSQKDRAEQGMCVQCEGNNSNILYLPQDGSIFKLNCHTCCCFHRELQI